MFRSKSFVTHGMAFALMASGALLLSGCGKDLSGDVAQLQQENADLKARVGTLEGEVQSLVASLPNADDDNDTTSNASSADGK